MRLFTALDISNEARAQLKDFIDGLKIIVPQTKFVRVESLHVTLKFLGSVPANRLDALQQALVGIRALPFSFAVRGTGFFPDATRPNLFWAGIEAPSELADLAHATDVACSAVGFPREKRPYTPHLTLARAASGNPHANALLRRASLPSPSPLQRIAAHLEEQPFPSFGKMVATAFHLYESRPEAGGSIYSKVASFPLTEER